MDKSPYICMVHNHNLERLLWFWSVLLYRVFLVLDISYSVRAMVIKGSIVFLNQFCFGANVKCT